MKIDILGEAGIVAAARWYGVNTSGNELRDVAPNFDDVQSLSGELVTHMYRFPGVGKISSNVFLEKRYLSHPKSLGPLMTLFVVSGMDKGGVIEGDDCVRYAGFEALFTYPDFSPVRKMRFLRLDETGEGLGGFLETLYVFKDGCVTKYPRSFSSRVQDLNHVDKDLLLEALVLMKGKLCG